MTSRRAARFGVALLVVLVADALVYALLIGHTGNGAARLLLALASVLWLAAVVLLAALRPSRRTATAIVLGSGLVLGVLALSHGPSTSDDAYRYAWDAKVQLHGIDPYRYTPASEALAGLRDPSLFGAPGHCTHPFPGGCTSINRPTVHTIYPPVAEGAFVVVRAVSFGHGGLLPFQIAALLGSLLVAWLLLRWGAARDRPWLAAVWMWCPVVLTEYVNNAHIDWLAVLFVVLAYATTAVRRTGWAGALVGAAVVTKLYPVVALPSLMRRHPVAAVGAAIGLVVLVYIPHVAAVGSAVIGYLPGYLQEENYGNGSRLRLIGVIVPHPFDTALGVVVVVVVAIWAWRRGDPLAPQRSAVLVMGVTLLALTPNYGWYSGLLVALVAMTGAFEWLPLCLAASYVYTFGSDVAVLAYLIAGVLAVVLAYLRLRTPARWCTVPDPAPARTAVP